MNYKKLQAMIFILLLAASGVLTLIVFRSYLVPLAFGGVLAVMTRPVFRYFDRKLKSGTAAAFLTIILIFVTILAPVVYFLAGLAHEVGGLYSGVRDFLDVSSLNAWLQTRLPPALQSQVPQVADEMLKVVRLFVDNVSTGLVGFFSNIFRFVIDSLVMFISAYYLLKDGHRIKKELLALSPLSDENDEVVFQRVTQAVGAVMNGMLIIGLIKGVLSALAFWIFGVPTPMFWGAMSGLAFFIPFLGSALIAGPACLYLIFTGHAVAALGLAIVSFAFIGTIDNFLQPKLVEHKIKIHPLLVLLSMLGGLQFYGFAGFILGPLTLAVTMALLDIYKKEFKADVETDRS